MLGRITVALETPDATAAAHALWEHRLWGDAQAPREVDVDSRSARPSPDWIERFAGKGDTVAAYFDEDAEHRLVVRADGYVDAAFDFEGGPAEVAGLLSELPFRVASFKTLHAQ
ncbi:hypothetical protein [Streptomyces sp. NPDC014744]|uniref:hypothetical protein n=1 Tax=Streptomyces sp. NPDC014744 TaxID=3364903 RepID=UPI0036FCD2E3